MNKKEELLQQLAEIENQERKQLIKAEYPKFKQLIGKCFKFKNSYSCPVKKSDYWYAYSKIVSIRPDDLYLGGKSGNEVLARCKTITFQKIYMAQLVSILIITIHTSIALGKK